MWNSSRITALAQYLQLPKYHISRSELFSDSIINYHLWACNQLQMKW
jgi:hypothetical protein